MQSRTIRYILTTLIAGFIFCGCSDEENNAPQTPTEGRFGSYTFGEEQIPVNSYVVSDGDWFLVMLSPLESTESASTYAVVGVHPELLGQEVDVEQAYPNSDYVFVYEDPTYYHAPFRRLQNGTIDVDVRGEVVSIEVDVVTFDGRQFTYKNDNLKLK